MLMGRKADFSKVRHAAAALANVSASSSRTDEIFMLIVAKLPPKGDGEVRRRGGAVRQTSGDAYAPANEGAHHTPLASARPCSAAG